MSKPTTSKEHAMQTPAPSNLVVAFDANPCHISARIVDYANAFATRADAAAFVALLPKSCKVRASEISGPAGHFGYINFRAQLRADGINGGRNETGIRRYRTLVAALDRLGVAHEYAPLFTNSFTEAEFAAITEGA